MNSDSDTAELNLRAQYLRGAIISSYALVEFLLTKSNTCRRQRIVFPYPGRGTGRRRGKIGRRRHCRQRRPNVCPGSRNPTLFQENCQDLGWCRQVFDFV